MNREDLAYIQGRWRANPCARQLKILAQENLCSPEDIVGLLEITAGQAGNPALARKEKPRKAPRALPLERRAQLITRMTREGLTARQTAREGGVPVGTVWGWLANVRTGRYDEVLPEDVRQTILDRVKRRTE